MLRQILASSRFLVIIAVIGSFLGATTLLIYGGLRSVQLIIKAIEGDVSSKGAKILALGFIEVVDLFLLGTVFYIIALGLYELFIDDQIPVPAWIQIKSLDALKSKLTAVTIVVMGVLFLGQVVTWDGKLDLLPLGAAIALVIASLTYFLSQKSDK